MKRRAPYQVSMLSPDCVFASDRLLWSDSSSLWLRAGLLFIDLLSQQRLCTEVRLYDSCCSCWCCSNNVTTLSALLCVGFVHKRNLMGGFICFSLNQVFISLCVCVSQVQRWPRSASWEDTHRFHIQSSTLCRYRRHSVSTSAGAPW